MLVSNIIVFPFLPFQIFWCGSKLETLVLFFSHIFFKFWIQLFLLLYYITLPYFVHNQIEYNVTSIYKLFFSIANSKNKNNKNNKIHQINFIERFEILWGIWRNGCEVRESLLKLCFYFIKNLYWNKLSWSMS